MFKSLYSNGLSRGLAVALLCALLAAGGAGVLMAGDKDKDDKTEVKDKDDAWLGVYMQDLTRSVREGLDLKVKKGVLINGVADDSPAEKAGLEDGDVIVMFNGRAVESADDLRDAVDDLAPGDEVKIQFIREGETRTVTATLGEEPDDFWVGFGGDDLDGLYFDLDRMQHHLHRGLNRGRAWMASFGGPRLGVTTAELTEGLAEYFDTKPESGVLVLDVIDDSVAKAAGVKSGDVIQKIDDTAVTTVDELRKALEDFDEGDEFTVTVLRKGKKVELKATMDDSGEGFAYISPEINRLRSHDFRAPRVYVDRSNDELREELNELREELRELKEELNKKKD